MTDITNLPEDDEQKVRAHSVLITHNLLFKMSFLRRVGCFYLIPLFRCTFCVLCFNLSHVMCRVKEMDQELLWRDIIKTCSSAFGNIRWGLHIFPEGLGVFVSASEAPNEDMIRALKQTIPVVFWPRDNAPAQVSTRHDQVWCMFLSLSSVSYGFGLVGLLRCYETRTVSATQKLPVLSRR